MKSLFLTIFLTFTLTTAMSQSLLTVRNCWDLSKMNYNNIDSNSLIDRSETYTFSNANLSILPTTPINANNNYKDLDYSDMGLEKSLIDNYYTLSDRIVHLYYSVILLRRKLSLNEEINISLDNLLELTRKNKKNISNLDKINRYIQALDDRKNIIDKQLLLYYDMLSKMINKTVDNSSKLEDKDVQLHFINLYGSHKTMNDYNDIALNRSVKIRYSDNKVSKINSDIFGKSKRSNNYKDEITQNFLKLDAENKKIIQNLEIIELSKIITENIKNIDVQNNIIFDYYNHYMANKDSSATNLLKEIIIIDNLNNIVVGNKVQLIMATKRYNFINIGLSNR